MHDHVAMHRRERPRFSLREVGMRKRAERREVPSLAGVGAEENELRRHGTEVACFIGGGCRLMPFINDAVYG